MATHSSVLAWRIPGTGEPIGLPSMGWHSRPDHPQFVYLDGENKLVPVTEEIPVDNTNNFIKFVKALFNA